MNLPWKEIKRKIIRVVTRIRSQLIFNTYHRCIAFWLLESSTTHQSPNK